MTHLKKMKKNQQTNQPNKQKLHQPSKNPKLKPRSNNIQENQKTNVPFLTTVPKQTHNCYDTKKPQCKIE